MGFACTVILLLSIAIYWASRPALSATEFVPVAVQHFSEFAVAEARQNLRVVSYNIGYASGDQNNRGHVLSRDEVDANLDAVAEQLRTLNADVVGLQEVDFAAERSYDVNQAEYLARALRMPYVAYAVTWNLRYLPWPYWPAHQHFGRIVSGQAVLSRYPITEHQVTSFAKPDDNPFWYNWFYLDRIVQRVDIDFSGERASLWHTHLDAFSNPTRIKQAEALVALMEPTRERPQLLFGDLNSTSFVQEGIEDWAQEGPEALQVLLQQGGLRNAETERSYTFSSWEPFKKIDHILYNGAWSLVSDGVATDTEASDHLPVWAELRYSGAR